MKIEKDESGNIWVDGELCINVPVKIDHLKFFKGRLAEYTLDQEGFIKMVNDSLIYRIHKINFSEQR